MNGFRGGNKLSFPLLSQFLLPLLQFLNKSIINHRLVLA
uniref:Uncharacterized protein n=1 Tax=Rhizophora mucronata TaxID=61149 RepID=A0A2P2PEY1_RHIMU